MRHRKIVGAMLAGVLAVATVSVAATSQATQGAAEPSTVVAAQPEPGTDAAIAWEALMSPDGEYAAAAAYAAVIAKYGKVEPYVTIRAAERRHVAALTRQLERYAVEVPANPYMGKIPAPSSLEKAAQAWATGEVDNVAMYDELIAETNDAQLARVLTNLRRSSLDSHLPMFEAAAENGGTLTAAQLATYQADHSAQNGGGGGAQGAGNGRGHGLGQGQGRGWTAPGSSQPS